MFEKFFAKYNKETKVRADKFTDTMNRLTSPKNAASSKSPAPPKPFSKSIPPMPETTKAQESKPLAEEKQVNNQFRSELSNLFGKSEVKQEVQENVNHSEDYCKNVIESVLKDIKADFAPHGRDVRVNVNTVLLLGSASVINKGRTEYEYSIQLKKGSTPQTTTIIVKESGLRGGWDVRPSMSNQKITEVGKEEYFKDFFEGYARYMKFKGWL